MQALNQVPYMMIKMKKEQLLLKNEENKATEQVIWKHRSYRRNRH